MLFNSCEHAGGYGVERFGYHAPMADRRESNGHASATIASTDRNVS